MKAPVIKVRAPASTANIGPGFDCLGAALSCGLTVEAGPGRASGDAGLVGKAAALVMGTPDSAPANKVVEGFPAGRGLGFSAAEVACGLLVGCELVGKAPDPAELLRIGTPLEGHPDNLAPALYGGLTLVLPDGDVLRCEPSAAVRPFVLVPETQLATKQARAVLPETVVRADAVANIARASGLFALLGGSIEPTRERLLECTSDLIHQPQRAPLMPQTAATIERLRGEGVPAAVSGAGPSVVCLVGAGEEEAVRSVARTLEGWRLLELHWDLVGARVLPG